MRGDRRFQFGVVVVVLILGACGWVWFHHTYEKVEVESEEAGMAPEARNDPYLALKTFFEALDIAVEAPADLQGPQDLEGAQVALVDAWTMPFYGWLVDESERWMNEGGHLILVKPHVWNQWEEAYLETFRIEPQDYSAHIGAYRMRDIVVEYETGKYWNERWMPDLVGADFVAIDGVEDIPLMISAPRGTGRLTVIMDDDWLTNWGLDQYRAGQLWADMLALQPQWPERMLFSMERNQGAWKAAIFRRGWPFFVALFLLLLLGFSRARRFGPPVEEPDRRRQRRSDHVMATGQFLWRHNGSRTLLEASRQALVDAVAIRRPSIRAMEPSRRYEVMAEELRVDEDDLRRLFTEFDRVTRGEDFRKLITEIEEMRRRL